MKEYLIVDRAGVYHTLKVDNIEVFANDVAGSKAPYNLSIEPCSKMMLWRSS